MRIASCAERVYGAQRSKFMKHKICAAQDQKVDVPKHTLYNGSLQQCDPSRRVKSSRRASVGSRLVPRCCNSACKPLGTRLHFHEKASAIDDLSLLFLHALGHDFCITPDWESSCREMAVQVLGLRGHHAICLLPETLSLDGLNVQLADLTLWYR